MITGTQHVSYTVSDVEKAREFFVEKLGLEATTVREVSGERVERIVGFPGLQMKISNITLADNGNIELVEYLSPRGKKIDLSTCNTEVAHLAFTVDDIDRTYRELREKGVKFVSPPQWAKDGALKGWGISYFRGPDGITMELMEAPKDARLHPATGFEIVD